MKTIEQTTITREIISKAFDYHSFNKNTVDLFAKGRTTNGDETEGMLNYTKLNIQRTNRNDKRGVIFEETKELIEQINTDQIWFVITEGWCGDSAQLLPYINKMAELNEQVELKIILRDEYPEVMDEFLTDGKSRSIPKVIILDKKSLEVMAVWGPRPKVFQEKYMNERIDPEIGATQAAQNLHAFYAKDKGAIIQEDFRKVLSTII